MTVDRSVHVAGLNNFVDCQALGSLGDVNSGQALVAGGSTGGHQPATATSLLHAATEQYPFPEHSCSTHAATCSSLHAQVVDCSLGTMSSSARGP